MFKKNIILNLKKWILYYAMSQKTDKFDTKFESNQPNQIIAMTDCLKANLMVQICFANPDSG